MRGLALTAFSLLGAAGCIACGVLMLSAQGAGHSIIAFGVVTLGYGLSVVLLLVLAWLAPAPRLEPLATVFGVSFFCVWTMGSLDSGGLQGLEGVSVVTVAAIVLTTRAAIRALVRTSRSQRPLR